MTVLTEINCPRCHAPVLWSKDNPHRPFCSERCKNEDFVAWANEEQVIGGDSLYDGVMSDDNLRADG